MNKKILLIAFAVFFVSFLSKAQTTLSEAEDFWAKDVNGDLFNLFPILDEGKIVVLTFFTTS